MADIAPFAAYRYAAQRVGTLDRVITQPYDKISPEMLERYLALSPYNLARVIKTADYRAAAERLREWRVGGALERDPRPALYPYFQTYTVPESGEKRKRKALIAALRLEEYSAGVVFRHEQTMAGPKQDRLDLLRSTRAHCELLFLLHDDPRGEVAALLDRAANGEPVSRLRDEYGDEHTLWRVDKPGIVEAFQSALSAQKLLIADGHHRYETALTFRRENPTADRVLVALVSMEAPGLTILPTHRLLSGVPGFNRTALLEQAARFFDITETTVEKGRAALAPGVLGACFAGHPSFFLLQRKTGTGLDVELLHNALLDTCLGIDEEAIRREKHVEYVREFEKGLAGVRNGAPACFFLHPVGINQVREIAFSGGVMPQKSTDFYPKMLSGLVVYSLEG